MPTAPINGTDIYYETHGRGFPLVFVHGGFGGLGTGQGGNIPEWVEQFAKHFEVILYDRRSSGRSGFPTTPHSMDQFADDIRELLRHLGHDRAHVWGTSAGGQITLAFGLRHPDAAASLVVADSAPWLSQDQTLLAKLKERIGILETKGVDAAYEARREGGTVGLNLFAAARPAQSDEEQRQRDERRAAIQAQLTAIPREERIAKYGSELRTYSAYADWDATARLKDLKMPILVLYGTGDTVFPNANWDRLTAGMPNVTYRAFEGAEHGVTGEFPAALDGIVEFLLAHTPVTSS
jgi:pimeloyl-ACP methyl ester carboxylesterase